MAVRTQPPHGDCLNCCCQKFLHGPDVIAQCGSHCGRAAKRGMRAAEIEVCLEDRNRMAVVFQLSSEVECATDKAQRRRPQPQVGALGVVCGGVPHVRHSEARLAANLDAFSGKVCALSETLRVFGDLLAFGGVIGITTEYALKRPNFFSSDRQL
jgi:hypothetical protein